MGKLDTLPLLFSFALAALACSGPMSKIEAIRDALVTDDAAPIGNATAGYPPCNDGGCLSSVATALGSKQGFVADPPDHAGAATAALVITRDGRGDWLLGSDAWLSDVKNGKGTGHDALRLAIARRMAESASVVGRAIDDDGSASAVMKAVAGAVPGACTTYWILGSGADVRTMPMELSADHSACVQHDLARREGPGPRYGSGHLRAAEGALALWRETERALRLGLPLAEPAPRAMLEKKLAIIEMATRKIATRKLPLPSSEVIGLMGDLHAEAGVPIFKARDAGTDAEAGAPR